MESRARQLAHLEADRVSQTMALEGQALEMDEGQIESRAREIAERGGLWRV